MNTRETVYVPVSQFGTAVNGKYHTNPDCRHLKNASNVREKPRDTLFDDLEECGTCSGEASNGGAGEGHIESLRRAAGGGENR